jgi:hypothetical protein
MERVLNARGSREEHERMEDRLRVEVNSAHQRHLANEGDPDDFRRALKRLNDFLSDGVLPPGLMNEELLSEVKRCQTHYNSDKNNAEFAAALIQALNNLGNYVRAEDKHRTWL